MFQDELKMSASIPKLKNGDAPIEKEYITASCRALTKSSF